MSIRSAEIELTNQGLILIQGKNLDDPAFDSNGAGKSSIFEALTYALFDKTVRGLKGDEVINLTVGKNCCVFLDMVDEVNNVPYRIARYRKHNEHKNNVYIYRDGKNITPKSTKDANAFIEQLIQIDYDTFINSILFGQGLIKFFSTASDSEKKAILEKMLNMTIYKEAQEKAKEKYSQTKDELAKLEYEESRIKDLMEEVKKTIETLEEKEKEHKKVAEQKLEELNNQLEEVEKKLIKESAESADYEVKLEKLNTLLQKVDKKLLKYKVYEDQSSEVAVDISFLKKELKRIGNDIEELKEEAEKIAAGEGTNCPACGQEITKETTEKALEHVKEKLREKLIERKRKKAELDEKVEELKNLQEQLEGKEELEKQKDTIQGEIYNVKAFIKSKDKILETLEQQKNSILKSIEVFKADMNKTYRPTIEEKENQLKELSTRLEEIAQERAEKARKLDLIDFWVKAFGNSGIKSYLLDSVTPFLNERANYYLSKLAGNTTEIEFSTQTRLKSGEVREKFEVRINNTVGGKSYASNSNGERRRIDLAISLALQDLVMSRASGKFNILLYDEIFDGLDAVGCENTIQLLQEIQKNVESIFVITHNDILKAYFDRQLTVIKEGGTTRVIKEG